MQLKMESSSENQVVLRGVRLECSTNQDLAELHGGSLEIESVPDKQTTITVSMVSG